MFSTPASTAEKERRLSAVILLRQTVSNGLHGAPSPMDILDERIAAGDDTARALKAKIEAFRTDFAKLGPQKPANVSRGTVIRAVCVIGKKS